MQVLNSTNLPIVVNAILTSKGSVDTKVTQLSELSPFLEKGLMVRFMVFYTMIRLILNEDYRPTPKINQWSPLKIVGVSLLGWTTLTTLITIFS